MRYEKRYSAPEELVTLLMERGLAIEKKELADKFRGGTICTPHQIVSTYGKKHAQVAALLDAFP